MTSLRTIICTRTLGNASSYHQMHLAPLPYVELPALHVYWSFNPTYGVSYLTRALCWQFSTRNQTNQPIAPNKTDLTRLCLFQDHPIKFGFVSGYLHLNSFSLMAPMGYTSVTLPICFTQSYIFASHYGDSPISQTRTFIYTQYARPAHHECNVFITKSLLRGMHSSPLYVKFDAAYNSLYYDRLILLSTHSAASLSYSVIRTTYFVFRTTLQLL